MSFMTQLVIAAQTPSVLAHFRKQCALPKETQERLLEHIIRKNQESEFGKDHGFKQIRSFGDFRKQVPISAYEDLKPYVDRAFLGFPSQLTAQTPEFFAMTSGTTGVPKYIPVTSESRSAKAELMRVWVSKLCMDHPGVLKSGRVLTVVSPEVESYTPAGFPCGAETGHWFRAMPEAIRKHYSCPYEVFTVEDYEAKYYLLLRIAAAQNIAVVYTCNPSTVLLLGQRLARFSEHIIRDVRSGTISSRFKIPADLSRQFEGYIKADPARARFLEQAARRGDGKLLPKHVWPELAAICCWKGGSVGVYLSKFPRYFSSETPIRDIGYFSSEFRGSVPLSDEGSNGVLAVPSNIYEFFPADEDRRPGGLELLTVNQLEKGKQYFIYVTTSSGLYRYDMNDIIEVTGCYEKTPVIRFVQKGKGMVSFTGEKLSESQVDEAVRKAFESFEGNYEFIAAVGEILDENPRYAFLIEFEKPVETEVLKDLANRIEMTLCTLNVEYAAKRKSGRLSPMALRVVKRGEFDLFRKRAVENGRNDSQFKILKLTADESFSKNFRIEREASAAA